MPNYVTITVDGAKIRVPEGTSVLDAALDYGICIPHLCHMRGILPNGVCRLCIVELIADDGSSRITASCTLDVQEGMVVRAHSDRIMRLRRNIAEMLVAEAPNSRAIQDIAVRCGVTKVRYTFRNKDCVLCGKCVRVCSEIWRSKSLGFVGRGQKRHVALPFDRRPDFCKRCWYCLEVCPMTITPCPGPKVDELCGQCEAQMSMVENIEDTCVWCRLGEGFQCIRYRP